MIKRLPEVKYKDEGIGHFQHLSGLVRPGFTWGDKSINMAYTYGDAKDIFKKHLHYSKALGYPQPRYSINLIPEHKDKVVVISDQKQLDTLKGSSRGYFVEADAIFTTLPNIPLMVRPADCLIAVIYSKKEDGQELTGLVHTGWRGVDIFLATTAINAIIKLGFKPEDTLVGVSPAITAFNRTFDYLGYQNMEAMLKYTSFDEQRGVYYFDQNQGAFDQYISAGIKSHNIEFYDIDTYKAAEDGYGFSEKYSTSNGLPQGRFLVSTALNS